MALSVVERWDLDGKIDFILGTGEGVFNVATGKAFLKAV
jgi:hypothetical protein